MRSWWRTLAWAVAALAAAVAAAAGAGAGCEPITVDLCRGVGYNFTASPSPLGHETQADAELTLRTFAPLVQYGCSARLAFFLCAAYVPMCNDKAAEAGAIGPCGSLCEAVRARCYPVLRGFGFPWPAALDCARFPARNGPDAMCMEGPGEPAAAAAAPAPAPARADPPAERPAPPEPAAAAAAACSPLARPAAYAPSGGGCLQLCDADVLFTRDDKRLAEAWLAVLAALCLAGGLLAPLLAAPADRPPRILGPCYAAVAAGWGVRLALGRGRVACAPAPEPGGPLLLAQGGRGDASCALVFFLTYYFENAIAIWWVILLASWGSEGRSRGRGEGEGRRAASAFQRCAPCLHLLAWGAPAALSAAAFLLRRVDADELTGMCSVGNHSEEALLWLAAVPQSATVLLSLAAAAAGLPRFGARRATLACLHLASAAGVAASLWHRHWHAGEWVLALPPSPAPRVLPAPPFWLFLFRSVSPLLTGTLVSVWTCLPDSGDTCRAALCPEAPKKPPMVVATNSPHGLYYYQQPRVHRTRRKRKLKNGGETLV